jgi:two-component system CheB/CheR fusion protein
VQAEADRAALAEYSPPGVVIDDSLTIVQFRGDTGAYLAPAAGAASFSLMKMARREIAMEVRAAVTEARRRDKPVRRPVRLENGGRRQDITIAVLPLRAAGSAGEKHYLVLFETPVRREIAASAPAADGPAADGPARGRRAGGARADDDRVRRLEHDLAMNREYLQSIIDERESANEELRSALEEIQSSNEELQSTNEELETAKEELQSTNEELTTVNEELQNRNLELVQANSDLVNLLSSVNIPILMLGSDLRIRRFTPTAERILNLIPSDVGRPLADLRLAMEIPGLDKVIGEVLDSLETRQMEVRDRSGRWYSIRIRPYRTVENKIDGVVIVVVDIDAIKRGLDDLRAARDTTQAVIEAIPEPFVVLDGKLRVRAANRAFYRSARVAPDQAEGRALFKVGQGQWNVPELRAALQDPLPADRKARDLEIDADLPRLGRRRLRLHARRLEERGDGPDLILLAMEERQPTPDA